MSEITASATAWATLSYALNQPDILQADTCRALLHCTYTTTNPHAVTMRCADVEWVCGRDLLNAVLRGRFPRQEPAANIRLDLTPGNLTRIVVTEPAQRIWAETSPLITFLSRTADLVPFGREAHQDWDTTITAVLDEAGDR